MLQPNEIENLVRILTHMGRTTVEKTVLDSSDRFSDWQVNNRGGFILDDTGRKILRHDGVSVDNTVFNMARIWKLYATMACKGENTHERPHRRSYLHIRDVKPLDLYAHLDEIIPERETAADKVLAKQHRIRDLDNSDDYPMLDVPAYLSAWDGQWRIKEKGEVTWYQFRICPLHTDYDGHEWECGICQFSSGKLGAKCMHDPSYGWQDFKAVLGDPREFYISDD